MKTSAKALQIADSIRIGDCKDIIGEELRFSDRDELFYRFPENRYLYVFKYGVVCFYNFQEATIAEILKDLKNCCQGMRPESQNLSESISIDANGSEFKTSFDHVSLQKDDPEIVRMIMLNLSQSVALDYFASVSEQLLEETRVHTSYLETNGKLDIGGRKLKRYIGKVLNVKNKIAENLYIFDSPNAATEDEALDRINTDLNKMFDLKDRYQSINQQLTIVKDNLELFKDIMFHKESSKLEWIIIILILIEVVDLFILKML